ncbi:hypothetical protein SAMN05428947_10635 [Mucilaginibacter sp. OK283]|jgi:hypothetical protein|nr:hypothetical protein SAMN05428947_10635 [Mucilaginibacter sp. OK283]
MVFNYHDIFTTVVQVYLYYQLLPDKISSYIYTK